MFFEDTLQLRNPDWSSTGLIAATALYKGKYYQWVLDPEKQTIRRVTENGDEYNGKWGPDGEHLIYYTGRNDSIMTLNIETGIFTCLSNNRYIGYYPEIGPDNECFIFISDVKGGQNIWMGKRNVEEIQQLTFSDYNYFPSWYNNGQAILLSRRIEEAQVYSLAIPSNTLTQLTFGNQNASPAVSAQGKIACVHQDTAGYFPAILTEGKVEKIGAPFTFLEYLEWSPDGSHLVMTGTKSADVRPDQQLALFYVEISTGKSEEIVPAGRLRNPVWISGTDRVVYSAPSSGDKQDLWMINVKTKEKEVLLKTSADALATDYDAATQTLTYFERINYSSYRAYTLNLETKDTTQLPLALPVVIEPIWNSDRSKLLFIQPRSSQYDLSMWDPATDQVTPLTHTIYRESPPQMAE